MIHQLEHINGSCGKRGCDSRDLILPHDGSSFNFLPGLHGSGNDIQKMEAISSLLVDKDPKEEAESMARTAEGLRAMRILQWELDPYHFI